MTRRLLILGAGGDLAHRLLIPALVELAAADRLQEEMELVGSTRHDLDDESFRDDVRAALAEHADHLDPGARESLVARFVHRTVDATDAGQVADALEDAPPTIVYLALPPALFEPAIGAIADCHLPAGSKIVVEKPFGEDLASARRLNQRLAAFDEDDVYRMDHFLGLPATGNLLALRFANRLFELAWSAEQIERIEVTWEETLGLEGRAGYYDEAGALRDMIQNHLLALLSVALMERPSAVGGEAMRSPRVEVLRALQPPDADELHRETLRARYTAGAGHPAYAEEDGVDPERETETLAQIALRSDAPRWRGVPLVLRAGKALGRDRHELVVRLRPPEGAIAGDNPPGGSLRLDLDTAELCLEVAASADGPAEATPIPLRAHLPSGDVGAYATMLARLFAGDHAPFIRADEAEEAWRIVQPILDGWAAGRAPLREYRAGSEGPG
jgi:glucose-6-phosphate 1-dehydrogenase